MRDCTPVTTSGSPSAHALGLAAALALGACTEPVPPEPAPRPNVLLVVVDTLRADHLGFQGYARATSPNLDALAEHGNVFLNATSTAPWTNPAVLSLFTGLHPGALGEADRAMALPEDVPSLGRLLAAEGYRTHGVVSHLYVGEKFGFSAGFESWDQENAKGHTHVSSEDVTALALARLMELDGGAVPGAEPAPFFLYLHYFDPHYDYLEHEGFEFSSGYTGKLESARDNIRNLRRLAESGKFDQVDLQHLVDLYDSEVSFTDHHIGRVLAELERRGLYDDTLIVVTADHGEALAEREDRWIGHTVSLHEEVVHVPLVIKLPGSRARTDVVRPVSTVDLLPTLAAFLRLELPEAKAWSARSLLLSEEEQPAFVETLHRAQLQGVRSGDWKLIHDLKSGESRLFDLAADPGESSDLAAREPERVAELEALRAAWGLRNARLRELYTAEQPELTPEEIEQLRALGYTRF